LLRPRDPVALAASLPPGTPPAWRSLDVALLQHAVLDGLLGIGAARLDRGDALEYTEDGAEALEAVASGRAPLAFLVNATPVEQILAVADTGERMPQKSTFFYPKLATGLVMYRDSSQQQNRNKGACGPRCVFAVLLRWGVGPSVRRAKDAGCLHLFQLGGDTGSSRPRP
jgi:hypothetical protein